MKTLFLMHLFLLSIVSSGEKLIYVEASRVFDGRAVLRDKIIVIQNDRIQKVVDGTYAIPDNAEVIDATGQTVTPGFIDSHIHFMAPPMPYVVDFIKLVYDHQA